MDKKNTKGTETVCQEADRIVSTTKREEYGSPTDSLDRLAQMWSGILNVAVTGHQVGLCLIALKVGRECHKSKRDSLVDICGYAKLLDLYHHETR